MPSRMLGRRPPKRAAALRLGRYLTGAVPAHPASADHFSQVTEWILGRNDEFGDCGPVSVANQRLLITAYLTGKPTYATQDEIFDLYRRSGNPRFDPNDPGGPGDGGVDMQTMCEALLAGGIGGVKPLAFAQVDHTNLDELRAAIAIFGSLLLGVDLETAQQEQTDAHLWDYRRSGEWGGHAFMSGRYTTEPPPGYAGLTLDRTGGVTWAEVVDCTDAFLTHQLDEAWVCIWPEHLGSKAFIEGVDRAVLAADYEALTGRPFPTPAPSPSPPATDGLAELVALLKQFVQSVTDWFGQHRP